MTASRLFFTIKKCLIYYHGGANPGAVYQGRQEKDDALALVLAIGPILEANGVDVVYTRTTDVYESPYQKAMEANEAGADYFVSIHRNSSPYPNQYTGVESLVYSRYGQAARMAYNINDRLEEVGFVNQGVNERPNLVVLNSTEMPAVLVEVGFINTDADNALLDARLDETARAIADSILQTVWS
ncbi:MAG: N-acetylmuramoyl-L-alanine amidase [Lachnospiraceae bacterium]|nr:N-acetylmuramoyl-L-alanine amidase [Lachnospiraceae bacterium]